MACDLPLPRAYIHDLSAEESKPVAFQIGHDGRDLQVHAGCCFGVRVPQGFGEADLFLQVFQVGGEIFLVAQVVDRLQGVLLKREVPVEDVAHSPIAVTVF